MDTAVAPLTTRLPPRAALVAAAEIFSTTRMQRDITFLADESLAGRGLGTPQLERAADYIAEQFRAAGLRPGGDGEEDYFQTWQATLDNSADPVALKNVIAILPGTDPERAGESLVIGAHYDHLGRGESGAHAGDEGRIHPGADDNASGIAVMLELARESCLASRQREPLSSSLLAARKAGAWVRGIMCSTAEPTLSAKPSPWSTSTPSGAWASGR